MSLTVNKTMSRLKKTNKLDPRITASQPSSTWATKLTELLDTDNLELPPLPQRVSRRNNPTGNSPTDNNNNPSNNTDTVTNIIHNSSNPPSGSSIITNNPTETVVTTNMDTTTGINTIPTTAITISTNTNTRPTSEFSNVISNISSYKENLIHQLLGTQGRATTTLSNNTTASGQLAPSGPVSPVDQVNDKLKSLLINLQQPLEQLSNLTLTIKNIGNVVSQGNIPAGCTPVCRLGIPNPPEKVTTTWNRCLFECGKQLTAILVAYHNTLST